MTKWEIRASYVLYVISAFTYIVLQDISMSHFFIGLGGGIPLAYLLRFYEYRVDADRSGES